MCEESCESGALGVTQFAWEGEEASVTVVTLGGMLESGLLEVSEWNFWGLGIAGLLLCS